MKHAVVLLHVNEHRDTLVILQPEPYLAYMTTTVFTVM